MKNSLYYTFSLVFVSFLSLTSYAETINKTFDDNVTPAYTRIVKKGAASEIKSVLQNDSLLVYTRGANGLIVVPPVEWDPFPYNVSFRDTVIYDPIFLPIVFDGKILPRSLNFISKDPQMEYPKFHLIPEDSTFVPLIRRTEDIQSRRRNFYMDMNNIGDVRYNASVLKSIPKLNEADATKRNFLHDLIATDDAIQVTPIEMEKIAPGFIYWTKSGEHSLQVSQNFISDNWNGGGNSSYVIKNYHKFLLNYKKDKVTFDNVLEWKLNLQKVFGAEKHGTNIGEDLLRMENTVGYQAFNKWSYSAKLETKTALFDSYPVNGDKRNTALFSPLIVNLGIGMNYTLEKQFKSDKNRKLKLSQSLSPFSLNYIYLNDTDILKKSGVEDGKSSKVEFGSLINTDIAFSFNRYMSITTRFKYFTNYERAEVELENKFIMQLSRFLSTNIQMYWRFDDRSGIAKDSDLGYFQLNEMVSFGLNYKW